MDAGVANTNNVGPRLKTSSTPGLQDDLVGRIKSAVFGRLDLTDVTIGNDIVGPGLKVIYSNFIIQQLKDIDWERPDTPDAHRRCVTAIGVYHAMLDEGIVPDDVTTLNAVIMACGTTQDYEAALDVFASMEDEATASSYGALVYAAWASQDWVGTVVNFQSMADAPGFHINAITAARAAAACAELAQLSGVGEHASRMLCILESPAAAARVTLDARAIEGLLRAFGCVSNAAACYEGTVRVIKVKARDGRVPMTAAMLSFLLAAASHVGKAQMAIDIGDVKLATSGMGLTPNDESYLQAARKQLNAHTHTQHTTTHEAMATAVFTLRPIEARTASLPPIITSSTYHVTGSYGHGDSDMHDDPSPESDAYKPRYRPTVNYNTQPQPIATAERTQAARWR